MNLYESSAEKELLMEDAVFQRAVERSQSLVNKVLKDIPEAHKSSVSLKSLSLQPSSESKSLQYMESSLGIPRAPTLKGLSADFRLETCLNHMSEGLQMYQDLLGVLGSRTPAPEKLTELRADITDLLAQVVKMRELGHLEAGVKYPGSGLASRLKGEYEVQVATHLTLVQLQDFARDVFRSLRNMAEANSELEG